MKNKLKELKEESVIINNREYIRDKIINVI